MQPNRIFKLEENHSGSVRHFLTGLHVSLQEGKKTSTVTVTRTGTFTDPRYGEFEITREMLLSMVNNFNQGVYGQDIFIDVSHKPENGAAAKINKLSVAGNRLRAEVEWTPYGIQSVTDRRYQYLSAEFHENWTDNEGGTMHGPVLLGAGLTIRPVIKHLDPVQLSEKSTGEAPTYLHPTLATKLLSEAHEMNEQLIKLLASLKALKLSEDTIKQMRISFETFSKKLGDDKEAVIELRESYEASAKQLAEALEDKPANVNITLAEPKAKKAPAAKTLSEDDVKRILADQAAAAQTKAATQVKTLADKRKIFTDAIDAAEGLDDDIKKQLGEAEDLITASMTDEQVKALAENQISMGNNMAASRQLSSMGFNGPAGSTRITGGDSNTIKALQETIDRRLGILDMSDSRRFAATGGVLLDENKRLADQVLAKFDAENAPALQAEHKMLAGGDGVVSDVAVPVSWERTVIREALYRVIGLQFVNVGATESFATSYSIPYSYRDQSAAGHGDTRRYEGQSISRAGVIQTAETAYNIPQKLSFEVSDELRLLTQARHLNWEAVAENQQNASRIIGEDTEQLIFNEVLNASDEFAATAVSGEVRTGDVDGTDNVFPLANFPVVHPRSVYDLQGNQVGSTINPVVVTYDGGAIDEYDGSGSQTAGDYYVMDYNLGEVRIVNEAGVLQTPSAATALLVSYSYTTNAYAFDTDLGGAAIDDHWNTFLYRFGLRKAIIEDDRYHMANYGLMSGTVATQIEQAKQFAANFRRPGTDLAQNGNIGRVKDVPIFKSTAPGLSMGDQRVIIGERGITRYRMAKAWTMGELENQKDANGRFTGKKEAYGDQFVVLHTPTQLKAALTSIVLYSATTRAARAE